MFYSCKEEGHTRPNCTKLKAHVYKGYHCKVNSLEEDSALPATTARVGQDNRPRGHP